MSENKLRIFSIDGIGLITEIIEERETEYLCKKGMGYKLIPVEGDFLDVRVFEYPIGCAVGSLFILRKNHIHAMTPYISQDFLKIYEGFFEKYKEEFLQEDKNADRK